MKLSYCNWPLISCSWHLVCVDVQDDFKLVPLGRDHETWGPDWPREDSNMMQAVRRHMQYEDVCCLVDYTRVQLDT